MTVPSYPYDVPVSDYPTAAMLPTRSNVTGVAVALLPGSLTSYAVVFATANNSTGVTNATLDYAQASYSPLDAKEIVANGSCGLTCGDLPINWSDSSVVASSSSPWSGLQIAAMGTELVVGATTGNVTHLYNWSTEATAWAPFGPTAPGVLSSMAAEPYALVFATLAGGETELSTLGTEGALLGQAELGPGQTEDRTVLNASVVFVPEGSGYDEALVISVAYPSQILFSQSADGTSFSTPTPVVNFTASLSDSPLPSVGLTSTVIPGGRAGQLDLTAIGGQLFLLYTTDVSGQTVPATEVSGTYGSTWSGPYFTGPLNGTAVDPVLSVGPTGIVDAAWLDPAYDSGAIEVATYFADGTPLDAPETIPSSVAVGPAAEGPPVLAVDALGRPLVLWSWSVNSTPSLGYTGGYLSAEAALAYLETQATESLGGPDFVGDPGGVSPAEASFDTNVSGTVPQAEADLSSTGLCDAQNLTLTVYQNVTHDPLSVQNGTGTVCAADEAPGTASSPLLTTQGEAAPNTYLAVYTDWALEAEGIPVTGSPLAGLAPIAPYDELLPVASLPPTSEDPETVQGETISLAATPIPYSPTSYELAVSGTLPGWHLEDNLPVRCPSGEEGEYRTGGSTAVTSVWETIWVDGEELGTVDGTTSYPSVWVYDLVPDESYTWSIGFHASTTSTGSTYDSCDGVTTPYSASPGIPEGFALSVSGNFSTTLSITAGSSLVTASFDPDQTAASLSTSFGTTLPTLAWANLTNLSGGARQSVGSDGFATSQALTLPDELGSGLNYTLSLVGTSRPGTSTPPGSPAVAYPGDGNSSAERATTSCSFTVSSSLPSVWTAAAGPIWGQGGSTTVDVSWFSDVDAPGFLTYGEQGSALDTTISEVPPTWESSDVWNYTVELHGLEPTATYVGSVGVETQQGCLTNQDEVPLPTFGTSSTLLRGAKPWTEDLPYDSVTQSGGGIEVEWSRPSGLKNGTVEGGVATISTSSAAWLFPFAPEQVTGGSGAPFELELAPPFNNSQTYTVSLEVNYTTFTSPVFSKVSDEETYHADTSGNGLTDAEQVEGWDVDIEPCSAYNGTKTTCGVHVHAKQGAYSTNGLASDYLEKELDLDPNTFDTASSGMLDLWNLTFSLNGSGGTEEPLPAGVEAWWENGSLDPFAGAEYPGGPVLGGVPLATNLTNLSCSAFSCAGNSSWSSEVLWSYSALQAYTGMAGYKAATSDGGVLRGVVGSWRGVPTLTLWGKMSWGADPLTSSTPDDGLADGRRVNPTAVEDLDLNVSWAQVCVGNPYSSPFNWALHYTVAPRALPGSPEDQGYSYEIETTAYGGSCSGFNYQVTLPVNNTRPSQKVTFSFVGNLHGDVDDLLPTSTCAPELTVDYDLLVGGTQNLSLDDNCNSSELAFSLNVSVSAVDLGAKVPTYLLVPPGDGTLRTLPDGQSEYVGEDAFDVVVVNVNSTTPVTSDPIPEPDSASTYQLTLQPGPNAFLVPRTQFLNTTLGYALLRNEPMPEPSPFWSDTAPLIGSAEAEAMQNLTGDNWEGPLGSLSCYWQQRSLPETPEDSDSSGVCGFPEGGVLDTSPEFVNVNLDGANATSTNAGGLPSDPTLEDATDAGGSLQGLFLVNVNNTTYDNLTTGQEVNLGPVPSLDLLLAALLDNTTEGVNGTIQEVTPQLYGLGLSWAVLTAIPNATLVYSAVYGPPTEVQTSQTGGCSWLGCVWEALTSIPEWFVYGVGYFFSGDWIVTFEGWAASVSPELFNMLNGFFEGVWHLIVDFASVVNGLFTEFGRLVEGALDSALNLVMGLEERVLDAALSPYNSLRSAFGSGVDGAVDPTGSGQVWSSLSGPLFSGAFLVAVVLQIATGVITALSLGADFLVNILVSLVLALGVSALLYTLPSLSSPSPSMVYASQDFADEFHSQAAQESNWTSWADAFGYWENGLSDSYAAGQLTAAWSDVKVSDFAFGAQAASFAFALEGSAMEFYAQHGGGMLATISGIVLGMISVLLEIPGLLKPSPTRMLDGAIFGLDGSTVGISIAELKAGY